MEEPAGDVASLAVAYDRVSADGDRAAHAGAVAVERPVAIEFNGLGYAVMMATPADIEDFAIGFALSERLIAGAGEVIAVDRHATAKGDVVRVTLAPGCGARVAERVRHRVSESSCGLCGIENLEQALRPLPAVTAVSTAGDAAIFRALAALGTMQPLNRATGAVHAAALCAPDGAIRAVRSARCARMSAATTPSTS